MPTTPAYDLPYPAPSSTPDVPFDLQALAEAVETRLEDALVKPAAVLTRSSQTAVGNVGYQKIPLNASEVNRGGMGSTVTSRITATRAGLYLVSGCVAFSSNASGVRYSAIYKNGTIVRFVTGPAASGGPTAYALTFPLELAVGDYLELYGVQNTAGTLDTQSTPHGATYLSAVFQED